MKELFRQLEESHSNARRMGSVCRVFVCQTLSNSSSKLPTDCLEENEKR